MKSLLLIGDLKYLRRKLFQLNFSLWNLNLLITLFFNQPRASDKHQPAYAKYYRCSHQGSRSYRGLKKSHSILWNLGFLIIRIINEHKHNIPQYSSKAETNDCDAGREVHCFWKLSPQAIYDRNWAYRKSRYRYK